MNDNLIHQEIQKYRLRSWQLHLIVSLILLVFFNLTFWSEMIKIFNPSEITGLVMLVSIFMFVFLVINLVLNIFSYKFSYRIIYPIVFIGSALSLCFMNEYNIIIDRDMIQNIIETNPSEANDFINSTLIMYTLFLGILPSILVIKSNIIFHSFKFELYIKLKVLVASVFTISALLYISYPTYASIARNNRHLSHLIVPTNYIFAGLSYLQYQLKSAQTPFKNISEDTDLGHFWDKKQNKTVLILVIGETARADHMSLNGYQQQTTPKLSKRKLFNFENVQSCGTSTATSLPCLFSNLDREHFSKNDAKNSENLLDFLAKAGFSVQWRDNNTGCKGICNRVNTIDLTNVKDNLLCQTKECFDEILLSNLSDQIKNNPNNQVIVLHQKGSHGPSYYLRYPSEFNKFQPTCTTNELQKCNKVELTNTYDNTILYTDHVLNKIIGMLEDLPNEYYSSMVYISDHGESLGEKNIYLHGTPYFMAPDAQTHVPFFLWFSNLFLDHFAINQNCLKQKQHMALSHDNYFHTILGLMHVKTHYYDADKDIFNSCINNNLISATE